MQPSYICIYTTLGTLRNRSVRWMVNAYRDINNKDLILKVGQLTCIDGHI